MAAYIFQTDDSQNSYSRNNISESSDQRDLIICGYACKYFRDDEKAMEIDYGRHLVPCPWNTSLLMSKFDVRGMLSDLTPYDADINPPSELPPHEAAFELSLDAERYADINDQSAEQQFLEEEGHRRTAASQLGYSAVQFSYGEESATSNVMTSKVHPPQPVLGQAGSRAAAVSQQGTAQESTPDDDSGPYHVSEDLSVPPSMPVPQTVKQGRVIEKTAQFVAKQGSQMEIVLKTKQSGNPHFNFLAMENPLNAFYKHMVYMVRCNRFLPREPPPPVEAAPPVVESPPQKERHLSDDYLQDYLNNKANKVNLADTAYGKLLHKIQQQSGGSGSASPVPNSTPSVEPAVQPAVSLVPGLESSGESLPPEEPVEHVQDHDTQMQEWYRQYYAYYYPGVEPPHYQTPPPPPPPGTEFQSAIPTGGQRQIIDKMAEYVARNGSEFEEVVRGKRDARFSFLDAEHVHHSYYLEKRRSFELQLAQAKAKDLLQAKGLLAAAQNPPSTSSSSVSFQVKPREKKKAKRQRLAEREESGPSDSESESSTSSQSDTEPPTSSSSPSREKLQNKLAHVARDKLAQVNKADQLQAERKKKAAEFLARLRDQETVVTVQRPPALVPPAVAAQIKVRARSPSETLYRPLRRQRTPPAAYAAEVGSSHRARSRSPGGRRDRDHRPRRERARDRSDRRHHDRYRHR